MVYNDCDSVWNVDGFCVGICGLLMSICFCYDVCLGWMIIWNWSCFVLWVLFFVICIECLLVGGEIGVVYEMFGLKLYFWWVGWWSIGECGIFLKDELFFIWVVFRIGRLGGNGVVRYFV